MFSYRFNLLHPLVGKTYVAGVGIAFLCFLLLAFVGRICPALAGLSDINYSCVVAPLQA